MNITHQPEALRLAHTLSGGKLIDDSTEWADTLHAAAAELRHQHARITELEDVADMAIKRIAELDARDAAFEAVRKAFCNLQRYSFWLDSRGNVRRCADRSGNWVEFEAAHTLFEPQSVDAALAAQAKHGEAQQ